MMSWEIYPAKEKFSTYADGWDRLNADLYDSHPCLDSRFVGPLLDFFASGKEKLCIHRSNGVISGALILQLDGMEHWSTYRSSQVQITALLFDDVRLLDTLLKALPGFAWTIEFYAVAPRYSPDFSRFISAPIAYPHAYTIGVRPDNVKEVDFLIGDDEYKNMDERSSRTLGNSGLQPTYRYWLPIAD